MSFEETLSIYFFINSMNTSSMAFLAVFENGGTAKNIPVYPGLEDIMELGSWSLFTFPSIWGLIPLALYIVISMKATKNMLMPVIISVLVAALMAALGPTQIGTLIVKALGGLMGQVGLICMMGAGLGAVMNKVGVTETLCRWIVTAFHVDSKRKVIIVTAAVAFVLSLVVGSSASAAAIFIPFIVPLAAKFKVRPVTVATIDFIVGFAGMTLSPFSATNIAALEITGMTFPEYLVQVALLYVVVTGLCGFLLAFWLDKKLENDPNAELYELEDSVSTEIHPNAVPATIAFIVTFVASVCYMIFFGGGMAFTIFYMIGLMMIITVVGRHNVFDALNDFCEKSGTMFTIFLSLILLQVLLDIIDVIGGFNALGNFCQSLVGESGNAAVLGCVATLFGLFGINGSGAAQMAVIDSVFGNMIHAASVPVGVWGVALLFGSLPSNFLYPGTTHWTALGIARSGDLKNLLKVCLITVFFQTLFALAYCIIVPML